VPLPNGPMLCICPVCAREAVGPYASSRRGHVAGVPKFCPLSAFPPRKLGARNCFGFPGRPLSRYETVARFWIPRPFPNDLCLTE
jgi:hypothetical protein